MQFVSPTGISPVLQVHPTQLCNIKCKHCYTSSSPSSKSELRESVIIDCIRDAAELGYGQLALSGGEPLLYEPLIRILSCARSHGMLTTVTTNGLLASAGRWNPLAEMVDFAAVSIDGREAEHDAIRGQKGLFKRTLANIEVIRSSRVPFGLIFTLTQFNVDSLEFLVRLAVEQGACGVQVHPLTLDGRAGETMPGSQPDGFELITAHVEAARLSRDFGIPVRVDSVLREQLLTYRNHLVPQRPVKKFVDAVPILILSADATLAPLTYGVCPDLNLGSANEARLSSLAEGWLASSKCDRLVEACEAAWEQLALREAAPASYWFDQVSSCSNESQSV
jgi:Fe-coproporphyrin III synthase